MSDPWKRREVIGEATLYCGDAGEIMRELIAQGVKVQMCVTSPPYWGLRDYGVAGQIGLESTPEEYVANMVEVFRLVRELLADDGVLFLNLGDSYFGSGKGGGGSFSSERPGWREVPCGTSGKVLADYPAHDCLCGNLCGVCRAAYRRISHTDPALVSMLRASLRETNPAHKEFRSAHLPTSDCLRQEVRTGAAIQCLCETEAHDDARLRASVGSMLGECDPQLLDVCLRRASHGECLLCARSLGGCVPASADNLACTCDIGLLSAPSAHHKLGNSSSVLAYRDSTIVSLKPKDLIGIPWRVAFALQADGWYLRSDIIWAKPNPMPESVRDRCTKSHEYLFLLAKNQRYYYDADAIAEPVSPSMLVQMEQGYDGSATKDYVAAGAQDPSAVKARILKQRKPAGWDTGEGAHGSFHREGRAQEVEYTNTDNLKRNKRSVWTIPTQPYPEAHFATFPPALIEPCILAGSRPGDLVLDPFIGSGTTAEVSVKLGRKCIGIDLNAEYLGFRSERIENAQRQQRLFA